MVVAPYRLLAKAYICACHGACSANEVQLSKDENFVMNKTDRMF